MFSLLTCQTKIFLMFFFFYEYYWFNFQIQKAPNKVHLNWKSFKLFWKIVCNVSFTSYGNRLDQLKIDGLVKCTDEFYDTDDYYCLSRTMACTEPNINTLNSLNFYGKIKQTNFYFHKKTFVNIQVISFKWFLVKNKINYLSLA